MEKQKSNGEDSCFPQEWNNLFLLSAGTALWIWSAENDARFRAIDTVGHSHFMIMFSAAEVGMNVYLRIAYENTAGRGPFSLPVKAIII